MHLEKPSKMPKYDDLECRWCGKTWEAHFEKADPRKQPRMPCLGLRSGFVPVKVGAVQSLPKQVSDSYAIAILKRMSTTDRFEGLAVEAAISALEFRMAEFDAGDMNGPALCGRDEQCPHIPPCPGHTEDPT